MYHPYVYGTFAGIVVVRAFRMSLFRVRVRNTQVRAIEYTLTPLCYWPIPRFILSDRRFMRSYCSINYISSRRDVLFQNSIQRIISSTIPGKRTTSAREAYDHRVHLPAEIVSPLLRIKIRPISLFVEKGSKGMTMLRAPEPPNEACRIAI